MSASTRAILAVNAGSSSLKLGLYALESESLRLLARISATAIGGTTPQWRAVDAGGAATERPFDRSVTHASTLRMSFEWITQRFGGLELVGAGHRVVHGGGRFLRPTRIDADVLGALRTFNDLAPLHEPHNIRGIEACTEVAPALPQVACFDTAFHATISGPASTFALPRSLTEGAVRRYGFHGLSYEYIASALPDVIGDAADGRVIVAHLGHGASMCAIRERRSIATTMSMTPLDGLPMGTRCGALDPGVILHMQTHLGLSTEDVNRILNNESGLLGISGVSPYMEVLLASEDPHAAEAVDYFVYWAARTIGSLTAALGGLDALVFTAGIGEHSAPIRERIIEASAWLGLAIDPAANAADGPRISAPTSRAGCWVIPTDEEIVVARATASLLGLA